MFGMIDCYPKLMTKSIIFASQVLGILAIVFYGLAANFIPTQLTIK